MKRTSPRRQGEAEGVTGAAPPRVEAAPATPAPVRAEPAPPEKPPGVSWGWRLALFLWAASFVFLFLYELLMSLFRGGRN